MKKITLLGVLAALCLLAEAQQPPENPGHAMEQNITPLHIGDKIPDALWDIPLQVVNHPDGRETITLGEYKDKLIILDFWATWCTPCIRNFPKLHALQDEFGDKIKVLAVTDQDSETIRKFFQTGAGKEYTYVHSVLEDRVLSGYFPHRIVPHIVWIGPSARLINTTQAEDVTQTNIQTILDNQKTNMTVKMDINTDSPLFLSDHFDENLKLKVYSIFLKGFYPGLPAGNTFRKTKNGKIYGRQMTNTRLMQIYNALSYHLFELNGEQFNSKRMIIDVKEPALLGLIKKADGKSERNNLYSYELIVPQEKSDSLYYFMLADLNRYSDYTATIENRMVDCLVLVRTSNKDKIKSNGESPNFRYSTVHSILINRPLSYLLNLINSDTLSKLPIIDETDYTGNVDIEISGIKDIEGLKKELNRYDLDLIPAKRSLNMFVLKDK